MVLMNKEKKKGQRTECIWVILLLQRLQWGKASISRTNVKITAYRLLTLVEIDARIERCMPYTSVTVRCLFYCNSNIYYYWYLTITVQLYIFNHLTYCCINSEGAG